MPVLVSTHPGPVLFPSTGQPLSAVELRYLLYSSQLPLLVVQGREPKQRQFSGITRQDSIRKCVAQFLEVIIRLSRQTSRWRQHCDLLRNARRVILAQCSSNGVMTFMTLKKREFTPERTKNVWQYLQQRKQGPKVSVSHRQSRG